METFDLVHKPWIPVLDVEEGQNTGPIRLVGLREILVNAHRIREVYCDSPLETVALNRLLLALFIHIFSPEPDKDAWYVLWEQGHFSVERIDRYFTRYHDRFDLLHPQYPFYQHPEPLTDKCAPLSKLFHGEASGNNATLFGHHLDHVPRNISLADAARGIVCTQAAALGGGVSKPFNLSHASLVGGAVFWLRGRSLFEALLLNAPPHRKGRMYSENLIRPQNHDQPAWTQPLPNRHRRRPIDGYLDYLTWQARRLTLVTEQNQSGETVATGVFLTQGDKDEPVVKSDPLMATVVSNKKGNYPYGFRANRVLWRDSNLILKLYRDNTGGGPRTFWWIRDFAPMYINGDLEGLTEEVDVFGMVNDKAKVELWRHERMPIYLSFLLGKQERLDMLETLLQFAEQQEWILKNATKTVAEFLLSPPAPGTDAKPNADPKAVSSLRNTLEAELRFWVDLEPIFFQFMAELASAPQAEWQDLQWIWADRIYRTALDTFNSTTSMLDEDARQLRAVAEGRRRLGRINPYREHLITQKEESIL